MGMDISKNTLIRFLFYIGIIASSANIYNYVYIHFLYNIRTKVLCPSFGAVSVCEMGITAGWVGVVTGNILICLLLLKATERVKRIKLINRIEHFVCAFQVILNLWYALFFACMSADAGSTNDMRITMFISFFCANAFFFAINGILSILEQINRERFYH